MNRRGIPGLLLMSCLLAGTALPVPPGTAEAAAPVQQSCHLNSPGHKVQRVVHITFDNVHLTRDNPRVPSDLEQMPNLLNFLLKNGVVSGNHHTPLISHTAHDVVTALTGVYGARSGIPVANSYGFFKPDGSVGFQSSFLYWTATSADGHPQMANEAGKMAPAPWVPFTRAGCDVAGFSVANIEFESVPRDVDTVFTDPNSPERKLADDPTKADLAGTSFLGIAIHCAKNSPLCNNSHARPDLLPDEPGGYAGFNALYGHFHVQPVIAPNDQIKDLDGNVIQDAHGNPGFPGFTTPSFHRFDPTATQSLGYAARMLEAGVPVVYLYIADAHERNPVTPSDSSNAFGPGEVGYVQQLQTYDAAFGKFFARLAADGITKDNTLFVVTADENDHFVGSKPLPPNCDGVRLPCTYAHIGELNTYIDRLLLTQRQDVTPFAVHANSAPTFHIIGNPAQTASVTRTLEHDVDALTVTNPLTGATDKLSAFIADQAEMNLLHMITSVQDRSPTFTMFGNPDYFNQVANASQGHGTACSMAPSCVFEPPAFAWNHGDVQRDIVTTWFGMAGPGLKTLGRNDSVFSDHSDLRPTLLALLGLSDDYVRDGRALLEFVQPDLTPDHRRYVELARVYKQINAPVGRLGLSSLVYANRSIAGNDADYSTYLTTIGGIVATRNALAAKMIALLDDAALSHKPIKPREADDLIADGRELIARVQRLARCDSEPPRDDAPRAFLSACRRLDASDDMTSTSAGASTASR